MKFIIYFLTGILSLGTVDVSGEQKSRGKKPESTEGWIVVEEEVFTPLVMEPLSLFHDSEVKYRKQQKRAAAVEIYKAVSWLKLAAGHAMPMTKDNLDEAAKLLTKAAEDLSAGKSWAAADLSTAMAKASHALSEWHFFKAQADLARSDEKKAAHHLKAATNYLKHAADSAQHEFGAEFREVYDSWWSWDVIDDAPSSLSQSLSTVKAELELMAESLKAATSKQ